jgi:methylphosphotriester-DNA--protein-cysteine methyltransferase
LGRSSDSSLGRADTGRGNASDRSNGRSDAGLDRARIASDNLRTADDDLRRHPNLANDLHVNANDLRAGYQTELAANTNLTFGQYVAATRLAHNLGDTNPAITRAAILAGLAQGDSLGKTLRNLGLGKDDAKAAVKQADVEIKQSKRRN